MTPKDKWKNALSQFLVIVIGVIVAFIILAPFYWIFLSSFRTNDELLGGTITLWSNNLTFDNYITLFNESNFLVNLKNSLFVTFFTLVITLFLALISSYSLRRFHFFGKKTFQKMMLVTYLFPNVVLLVPLYGMASKAGLINSHWSLIIVYVTFCAPFCIWLLESFFTHVPVEVEEAAIMENATRLQILFRIYLPMIAPGMVSIAAFTIIYAWSEYLFAVVFINDEKNMTLPLALDLYTSVVKIDWGVVATGATMAALPIMLVFLIIGPTFLKNMTQGVIK